jgi:hypothetical protein
MVPKGFVGEILLHKTGWKITLKLLGYVSVGLHAFGEKLEDGVFSERRHEVYRDNRLLEQHSG